MPAVPGNVIFTLPEEVVLLSLCNGISHVIQIPSHTLQIEYGRLWLHAAVMLQYNK